jgi:hypothetical protein
MSDWITNDSPRLWRFGGSDFYGDEILAAADTHSDAALQPIAADGFTGFWLRGRLRELARTSLFPELGDAKVQARLRSLQTLIARARPHGLGLYLFFNDPLALRATDPFWKAHPDLAGQPFRDFGGEEVVSLCLSTPSGKRWFEEAVESVLEALPGLGGVILITASEHHSHCWSHQALRGLDDGITEVATAPLTCARCRDREPADLVAQLVKTWSDASKRRSDPPNVIAWNWSWSMWYEDPQREVIERLPDGVTVMADWERGGQRPWRGRSLLVDEYSLGYAGPSERFLGSSRVARGRNLPVMAKLQLGATHELATVPNLPLMLSLHAKLAGMWEHGVSGFMGCWNFGCSHTLNTHAIRYFLERPELDASTFLEGLAASYFGEVETPRLLRAWRLFGEAFAAYPFSIRMLYWSPMNDAPAVPLTFRYEARPLGGSWMVHEQGDRLEDCLPPFSIEEAISSFGTMRERWAKGVNDYAEALGGSDASDERFRRNRREELSTAGMVLCHLQAMENISRFHGWRGMAMKRHGLKPPCDLPPDREALGLVSSQIEVAGRALELVREDDRLGWHQECHARFCSEGVLSAAIRTMSDVCQSSSFAP